MSNFNCNICGSPIIEDENGEYITGCKHYPIEKLNRGDKVSEAREKYYKLKHELEHLGHDGLRGEIEDYIEELQQENKQLKESQKQKQIIKLCERLDKAEWQNEQMLKTLIFAYRGDIDDPSQLKWVIESVTGKSIDELLK